MNFRAKTESGFSIPFFFFQFSRHNWIFTFFQGSPLRWAAKADEIGMTSSVTSACSPLKEEIEHRAEHLRSSCSANQLDAIVDILGVPSELLNQKDYSNKRLFLLKEKTKEKAVASGAVLRRPRPPRRSRRNRAPALENGSKSKSCEEEDSRQQDLLVEVKRRSIYAKDCR